MDEWDIDTSQITVTSYVLYIERSGKIADQKEKQSG